MAEWKVLSFFIKKKFFILRPFVKRQKHKKRCRGPIRCPIKVPTWKLNSYLQASFRRLCRSASTSTRLASEMGRWWGPFAWMESVGHESMLDGLLARPTSLLLYLLFGVLLAKRDTINIWPMALFVRSLLSMTRKAINSLLNDFDSNRLTYDFVLSRSHSFLALPL